MCDQYHAKRDASEASGFLMFRLASAACQLSGFQYSFRSPPTHCRMWGSIGTAAMRRYIPGRAHPPPVRRHHSISRPFIHHIHATVASHCYLCTVEEKGITAIPSLLVFIMQDISNLRDRQFPTLFCDDNTWGIMVVVITGNADSTLHVIHPFYIVNIMLQPCSAWFRRSFVHTL